jgi:hypothetical protein
MYDINGCTLLLAAIVRLWWRDALRGRDSLDDLARFLEQSPNDLLEAPTVIYHAGRGHDDLPDRRPPSYRRGPAYTRRGIGDY